MAAMHDERPTAPLPSHAPILADDEIIEGTIVPDPSLILEITLNREEAHILSTAASANNMSANRYIKKAALAAARAHAGSDAA